MSVIMIDTFHTTPDLQKFNKSTTGTEQFISKDSDLQKHIIDTFGKDNINPDSFEVTITNGVVQGSLFDDPLENAKAQLQLASIINSNIDFVESDQSAIDNFFDNQVDLPEINPDNPADNEPQQVLDPVKVSERFVLETAVVKFDSNQNKVSDNKLFELNPSTIDDFSSLTLTDSDGNVLDLGAIQIGFFGVLQQNNNIDMTGLVTFKLDDIVIATKHLTGLGKTTDKKLRLNLSDTLTSERKQDFTFTFADEGKDWKSGEVHTFKIVVNKLKVQVQTDEGLTKFFTWNGEFTPYKLELKVDDRKQVVYDRELEQNISVFKDDGRLALTPVVTGCITPPKISVTVSDKSGNKLGSGYADSMTVTNWLRWDGQPQRTCTSLTVTTEPFIPRNAELRLKVESGSINDSFIYISPKTQQNISITCTHTECSSNIGWKYP